MTRRVLLPILTFAAIPFAAAQSTISTFAGNGTSGYAGDPGPATASELNYSIDVAADGAGNLYIADQNNNRIRVVDKNGVIATFAGLGTAGFAGDGGQPGFALLNNPTAVYVDPFGTGVYIADVGNQRIRLVANGVITTIAGTGAQGYGGDNGPAADATFYNPVRVITDVFQNIYIADQGNHRVRRIDYITGTIATFAGTGTAGFSGDGGQAAAAALNNPTSLATDLVGDIFICDQFNHRIRKVDPSGVITTIAGTGVAGFSGDGGPALAAELNDPGGMTIDASGNLFFSDDTNVRVREISGATGIITTVAGNGVSGYSGDGGPAVNASLNGNFGVTVDSLGNLLIADSKNNRVRLVGQASSVAPAFTPEALVNAASFSQGGSAGALATLFGVHLTLNLAGVVSATQSPLPAVLNETTITVNGIAAPMLAVSNSNQFGGQINFQIPWEVAGQPTVSVVVNNGMASSAPVSVPITPAQPGVFQIFDSNLAVQVGAVEHVDGSIVSSLNPAAPGETVVVFATGLGPVNPLLVTGLPAPASPISFAAMMPTVTIGGIGAAVPFSGTAPYFTGLNQMNITVPADAPSGLQPLIVSVDGVASPPVNISVR